MVRQFDNSPADERDSRSFLVLPENRLAYTAAMQWRRPTPGRVAPIVTLTGPAGAGKSHLARQAGRPDSRPLRVAHVTAAEFAAEWDEARRRRTIAEFYAEYLPAGRHEVHYFARVANAGDYLAAPATAELMYGNASHARTAADRVRIVPSPSP